MLGFTIHNTTEGLVIISPILRSAPARHHFLFMGMVAGVPTIAGTWIGGLTYSVPLSVLSLAIGAGAIFQVIYEVVRFQARGEPVFQMLAMRHNFAGLVAGYVVMYFTGFLIAV